MYMYVCMYVCTYVCSCSQLHQSHVDIEDEGQEGSGSTSLLPVLLVYQVCPMGLVCVTILLFFWLSPHLMIVLILPLCPDSSCVNSSCLTPQLSSAISLSSNSSSVSCSHGSHPAVLLAPNSEHSGNLSLFQGISSPTSVDKEPSLSFS